MPRLTYGRLLVAGLLLILSLATASSIVNPLFEPPDELQHYQYVRYLVDEGRMPFQAPDGDISQSHQPPLYYLIGAGLVAGLNDPGDIPDRNPFWAYDRAGEISRDNKSQFLNPPSQGFPYSGTALVVHVLRLWSVTLAGLTGFFVWLIGKRLWPAEPSQTAALMAVVMLNPMFLYIAGAVNNDNLVALSGAALLWLSLRGIASRFSWLDTVAIGFVWALALLAKLTGLLLAAAWITPLLWLGWKERDWRLVFSRAAAILSIFLLVAGWWFVRNMILYGEPFALNRVMSVWGFREQIVIAHLLSDLAYAWTSLWGRFGYGQVPFPRAVYVGFLLFVLVAAVGLVRLVRCRLADGRGLGSLRPGWAAFSATTLAFAVGLLYFTYRNPTGANGRYMFPALPGTGALLVVGFTSLFDSGTLLKTARMALIATMLALAVTTHLFFLPWTYARPALLEESEALALVDSRQKVFWGDSVELLGTSLEPLVVEQGGEVSLTACWRALATMDENVAVAVHVVDGEFRSLGQRDTFTGLGTFPSSYWQPGDVFCDVYPIRVSGNVGEPTRASVSLVLYAGEPDNRLPARSAAGSSDFILAGNLKLLPPGGAPLADAGKTPLAAFEDGVALLDVTWSADTVRSGDQLVATLSWRASGPLNADYTVFAQLLDEQGSFLTQDDGQPRGGSYPTSLWGDGELIRDQRVFDIPPQTPPGSLRLSVGLYLLADGRRLARADGDQLVDSAQVPGPTIIGP